MRVFKFASILVNLILLIETIDGLTQSQSQNQQNTEYYDQYGMMPTKPERGNNGASGAKSSGKIESRKRKHHGAKNKRETAKGKSMVKFFVTRRYLKILYFRFFFSSPHQRKRGEIAKIFTTDQRRKGSQIRRPNPCRWLFMHQRLRYVS